MPDTVLPEPLLHAYRSTHYRIKGQNWYLQIGEPQPALRPYYQRHAVQSAVYLTACNPLGELLPDEHNARRMEQLRQALQRAGWAYLEGFGEDPQGEWPGESSVLILGMDLHTARAWGQQWQQNALLYCGADTVPQLVLLR